MEELRLFEVEHIHDYTRHKGPIQTQPEITLPYDGTKWCWTCSEWVAASDGMTYSQRNGLR